jgi:CoA-transferase family III
VSGLAPAITKSFWTALGGNAATLTRLRFTGAGGLPSTFAVTDLASASIATAALAVSELSRALGSEAPAVTVDRRLSSLWFGWSIRPIGWTRPPDRDPITGDYRAKDGWIRLHCNAPHHRAVADRVLGCGGDNAAAAHAVARWTKAELEAAVVEAGGCAGEMRSTAEWLAHPQGRAVSAEPLALLETAGSRAPDRPLTASPLRPLAALRVLDLTRVLAGPVATRFLAGYGAEVLRIDPADWSEPGVIPEVTLGKRCAQLDLKSPQGRACFESLLAQADVLIHGYRPTALDRLGWDAARRRELSPGLIDVSLDAYGWTGPWAQRRGFDSLVQMSAGIAAAGMEWKRADRPAPLPVQALDHATGYLCAAAAIRGITLRLREGNGLRARLSLARTAKSLLDLGTGHSEPSLAPESADDVAPPIEITPWGNARRLKPPVSIERIPMQWPLPASELGSAQARWST